MISGICFAQQDGQSWAEKSEKITDGGYAGATILAKKKLNLSAL
jgi:hypothetical protein